jgi:tetratricopeptide (TPR) repeat protein
MMRKTLLTLAVFVCGWPLAAFAQASLGQQFDAAVKAFDREALAELQQAIDSAANDAPEDYDAQRLAAECYARRAAMNRNARHIMDLPKQEDKTLRAEQEAWGEAGLVFALRAIDLAGNDTQRAQAHRVAGELYSHQITGMISGLRNGPKAKRHIDEALEKSPRDPECLRAIGIMYLHNPPFNGGDVDKAVETFKTCAEAAPRSDRYEVLLAMAYRKRDKTEEARSAARAALRLNPENADAKHMLEALQ